MTHNLTSQPAVTHQFPGFAASSQRLGIIAWLRILIRRMPLAQWRLIHCVGVTPQRTYASRAGPVLDAGRPSV